MFKDFKMYALQYFRDAAVVAWYQEHGIFDKPEGYVVGQPCYATASAAQQDADHINRLGPSEPVTIVSVVR